MSFDDNPRIKRKFSIIAHTPNIVELRHGVWNPRSFTLTDETDSGRLFKVIDRLDGSASPSQIAAEVGVARAEVDSLLDHLDDLGVLETGPTTAFDHYIDDIVPNLKGARGEPPTPRPILLMGSPGLTRSLAGQLAQAEIGADIAVTDSDETWQQLEVDESKWMRDGYDFQKRLECFEPWRGKLLVVAMDEINPNRFQLLNRICVALGVPWMHAAVDGPFVLVGPIFVPNRSACYNCFEVRVMMNLREAGSYQRYKHALVKGQIKRGGDPLLPLLGNLLTAHTAMEIVNFELTGTSWTVGKVLSIYLPTMEMIFNDVLRLPGCPACAPTPERDDTELYFDIRATADH